MFTRQTLRRLANANSFQRGQDDDDEGNLTKLCREADGFYASVRGSRSCRVALRLAAVGLEFGCNCPYAFDGICKHSVALGLAVLDAYTPADLASASAAPAAGPPRCRPMSWRRPCMRPGPIARRATSCASSSRP